MKSVVKLRDGLTYLTIYPHGYYHPVNLPVITTGERKGSIFWSWNGSTEKPTLKPSIRTRQPNRTISHIWLNDGVCEYLDDSTDGNAGKKIELQDIPLDFQ